MIKNRIVLLVLWLIPAVLAAQSPCTEAMSPQRFRKVFERLRDIPSQNVLWNETNALLFDQCFNSHQVKQIAELFAHDWNKIEFLQSAYKRTTDQENYYEVYDALAKFSSVIRLYHYLQSYQPVSPPPLHTPEPTRDLHFPPYNYPAYVYYQSSNFCNPPVSDDDFIRQAREVFLQQNEPSRFFLLNAGLQGNCYTAAQIMKFASLLEQENNRLTFVKNAFTSTADTGNYTALVQLFSHLPYRESLLDFIKKNRVPASPPPPPPCLVSTEEFNLVKETVNKQSFNATKVTVAKQVISAKKCFTAQQIREIMKLFGFEESKLEIAKYAWDFCIDKQNYFSVNDAFTFSSSIEELNKFIQSKH
ncbi:MAG TPA: DUF4476 domain-containing protein [Bacteroidales bacterium]|nr:DUF4476 domain-containing protein [Bacteroidales bacterium]HSA43988.1 DUF4476 domain-containing protein [Bacteroidales bacterium]